MTQEIDPRFFIPPYVTGIDYKNTETPSSADPVQNDGSIGDSESDEPVVDTPETEAEESSPDENRLLPPDFITIISQTSRVTSGGMVVDVVIDVEDTARASQFEVRITK